MSGIASESPAAQQCKAPPINAWIRPAAPPARASAHLFAGRHIRIQRPSSFGVTTTLGELFDTPDANPAVERSGHDIADLDRVAGSNHPAAVDPNTASTHEASSSAPRLDDPCMPQPLVDALPVHSAALAAAGSGCAHGLPLLLGAALELLLERGELGKWRVRIDRPFTRRPWREVTIAPLMLAFVAITILMPILMSILAIAAAALIAIAMLTTRRFSWRSLG